MRSAPHKTALQHTVSAKCASRAPAELMCASLRLFVDMVGHLRFTAEHNHPWKSPATEARELRSEMRSICVC